MDDDLPEIDVELLLATPLSYNLIGDWESDINAENVADAAYDLIEAAVTRAEWSDQYRQASLFEKLGVHDQLNSLEPSEHYLTAKDIIILDSHFNPTKVSFELFGRALLGLPPHKLEQLFHRAGINSLSNHDDHVYLDILRLLSSARNLSSSETGFSTSELSKPDLIDKPVVNQAEGHSFVLAWDRVEEATEKIWKAIQHREHAIASFVGIAHSEITALKAKVSDHEREIQRLRLDSASRQRQTPYDSSPKSDSSESASDLPDANNEKIARSSGSSVSSISSGSQTVEHNLDSINTTTSTTTKPAHTAPGLQNITPQGPSPSSDLDDDTSSDESEAGSHTIPKTPTRQQTLAGRPASEESRVPETPLPQKAMKGNEIPLVQPKTEPASTASLSPSASAQRRVTPSFNVPKPLGLAPHDDGGVCDAPLTREAIFADSTLVRGSSLQQVSDGPPLPFSYSDSEMDDSGNEEPDSSMTLTLGRHFSSMPAEL